MILTLKYLNRTQKVKIQNTYDNWARTLNAYPHTMSKETNKYGYFVQGIFKLETDKQTHLLYVP